MDPPYVQAPAPAAPPLPVGGDPDSLTQLFAKSAPAVEPPGRSWQPAPAPDSSFPASPARPDDPLPAQGGFTQLFQALNQSPAATQKPAEVPPVAAPSGQAAQVGFTQLLETLSSRGSQAPAPPVAPPAAATPAPVLPASGQGEFTRVISASALRESQARVPVASSPTPPVARPPMPTAMPPMPAPPAPRLPMMPMPMPAPHAATPQMPAAMAPPAFSFPPAAVPPPAAPTPQPSGLQKHLPLILMVNVFLMLAILLVLFFVLRHR